MFRQQGIGSKFSNLGDNDIQLKLLWESLCVHQPVEWWEIHTIYTVVGNAEVR